ncbi:MAG: hypothetical protein HKL85_09090 [Acidimicrobiaceae bacterium]|nr:hypothetical protein [Acidimicrobiaceae bacterium]
MRTAVIGIVIAVVVVLVAVRLPTSSLRRRRVKSPGSSEVIVRCRRGHLFTTIWIPSISFTSVRLSSTRYQHCPVGHHWSVVVTELSDAERDEAARVHDRNIP